MNRFVFKSLVAGLLCVAWLPFPVAAEDPDDGIQTTPADLPCLRLERYQHGKFPAHDRWHESDDTSSPAVAERRTQITTTDLAIKQKYLTIRRISHGNELTDNSGHQLSLRERGERRSRLITQDMVHKITDGSHATFYAQGKLVNVKLSQGLIEVNSLKPKQKIFKYGFPNLKGIVRVGIDSSLDHLLVEHGKHARRHLSIFKKKGKNGFTPITTLELKVLEEWHFLPVASRLLIVGSEGRRLTLLVIKPQLRTISLKLPDDASIGIFSDSIHFAASGDGSRLAGYVENCRVVPVWDTNTGKQIAEFKIPPDAKTVQLSLSSTGNFLSVVSRFASIKMSDRMDMLNVFNVESGKEVFHAELLGNYGWRPIIFSPDERLIAECGEAFRLWELDTGRLLLGPMSLRKLDPLDPTNYPRANFSRSSRWLALVDATKTLAVWDVLTLKPLFEWKLPESDLGELRFSSCKLEVLAILQNQIAFSMHFQPKIELSSVQRLWELLAHEDPVLALSAQGLLEQNPAAFLQLISEDLSVSAEREKTVDYLVGELGDKDFQNRTRAMNRLKRLAPIFRNALRKHINHPDLEIASRVGRLLHTPSYPIADPHFLRQIRYIHSLEKTRSPDAIKMLRKIASNRCDALFVVLAREALNRIDENDR